MTMRGGRAGLRRALVLVLLALVAPAPAFGHAVLLSSTPVDREVLHQSPTTATLRFNEPVTPVAVAIVDGDGRSHSTAADVFAVDQEVRVRLAAPAAAAHDGTWRVLSVVLRIAFLVGIAGAAGGTIYASWVARGPTRSRPVLPTAVLAAAVLAAAVLAAAALLAIGVQGGAMTDAPLAALLDADTWRIGAGSTRGAALLLAAAGLLLVVAGRGGGAVALAGALLCVASFAVSDHAATAAPRWLAAPALLAHVLLAAFWLGSLPPLLAALGTAEAATRLERFSHLAVLIVPLLLAAGLALAILQVTAWEALAITGYGRLLLGKIALVACMLALAAYNRQSLSPALRAGAAGAHMRLRATIGAELALGALILGLSALLAQTEPPRAAMATDAAAIAVRAELGKYRAEIALAPGTAGRNTLTARITDSAGATFDPREVTLELSNRAAGIEPLTRPLARVAPGSYRLSGPEFALPGRWQVVVKALISDFEMATFDAELELRP